MDVDSAPLLPFDSVTFWIQLHNVPEHCLTQATGEVVGNTIGALVQVADSEDDGEGGEFLRVRVVVDIKKPLPRCCKLWSEGEHVGWALLKFERLPNFCYWCGKVTHGENDCDVWLRGKGRLKKENNMGIGCVLSRCVILGKQWWLYLVKLVGNQAGRRVQQWRENSQQPRT